MGAVSLVEFHINLDIGRVFVGRQRELAELSAALEEALSGQGRLFMLMGEPGIGKTRTTQELASYAENRGAQVFWGRIREESGAPPYWPWIQVIRAYVGQEEPQTLYPQMGAGASDIAELVPELREKLGDLAPSLGLEDTEAARFRLFESIGAFLKNASQRTPLVLVLDNLHWTDASSLRLLEFVAQDMDGYRLLILGTYRDVDVSRGHPLYHSLGEFNRQGLFERLSLRGLGAEEVGEMIRATAHVTAPQELVALVHHHTEGNPFFVGELIRLLGQEGLLAPEKMAEVPRWQFRVPEGIREMLGRRLDKLSPGGNEALKVASVVGREFGLDLLKALVDRPEEQLVWDLEEALAARVIEELPQVVGRYQFAHVLIQHTLLEELSLTRQVRLHAQIAQSLEGLYGAETEAHAGELARHFEAAEAILGPDKLVHYSLIAGERALAAYAYQEALEYFQRGLAARQVSLNDTTPAPDAETAALLFGLARAQSAVLDTHINISEALRSLTRAFDFYAGTGEVERAVAVAAFPGYGMADTRHETFRLLERALELVPEDSLAAARLLARFGETLRRPAPVLEDAPQALSKALHIARREGDAVLEMRVLGALAAVQTFNLRHREAIENCEKAIELAGRVDAPYQEVQARYFAVVALTALGDLEGARRQALAMLPRAERIRDRWWLSGAFWKSELVRRLEGDWEGARGFSGRGLAASPQRSNLLAARVLVEFETGNFGQGEAYAQQLLDVMRLSPSLDAVCSQTAMVLALVSRIANEDRHLYVVEATAKEVVAWPAAPLLDVVRARIGLTFVALRRADLALAAEQYTELLPWRGTLLGIMVTTDRLLGLLTQILGNQDQAAEHFEEALAFCRKAGYRPELAWTCCDYADCLIQRQSVGDRSKAITMLDECLAISSELGMTPLVDRANERREGALAEPGTGPAYPDGLTEREVEVLRLVAAGKSNPEIGEELFISPRTVTTHVSNILNKINAANRAEAAAFATRNDLV